MDFYLYPIIDWQYVKQNKIELSSLYNVLLERGFYQLRIKDLSLREVEEVINHFNQLYKNIKIILNDYWQIFYKAQGIHLGIEDISKIDDLKAIFNSYSFSNSIEEWLKNQGQYIFGISTHNFEQFQNVYNIYKDYLGYLAIGPCFSTTTKKLNYDILNKTEILRIMEFIVQEKIQQSIVFIGGINQDNLKKLYSLIETNVSIKNQIYYASISSFLRLEIPSKFNFTHNSKKKN